MRHAIADHLSLYPIQTRIVAALCLIIVSDLIIDYFSTTYAGTINVAIHIPLICLTILLAYTIRPRKPKTKKAMAKCYTCGTLFVAEYEPGEESMLATIECPQCFFSHTPQMAIAALMRYLNEEYEKKGSPRLIQIIKDFEERSTQE